MGEADPHPHPGPWPLREYALLADGERGALVGPDGDVAWMCTPHWDSDALFAGLIGGTGRYAVTPCDAFVWGGWYEDPGLIHRLRWTTRDAVIECRQALVCPPDADRAVLLRRVTAVDGPARVRVVLEPGRGLGGDLDVGPPHRCDDGAWVIPVGPNRLHWTGAADAAPQDRSALVLPLVLAPGEHRDLVLEIGPGGPPRTPRTARAWQGTETFWESAVPSFPHTFAPREARFSHAVLRGLTTSSGGTVAAVTTSLPECAEEGRNYDYRYVWIRDQCLIGQGAAACGSDALLDGSVRFVSARLLEDGPDLVPACTASGGPLPDERPLDLAGYPGGHGRVGNRVGHQFQLDSFGESLLLFAAAARAGRLDATGWNAAVQAAHAVEQRWQEPDAGMWELDPRPWTHSRLICVAGLAAMARAGAPAPAADRWTSLADRILAHTATTSLGRDGAWQRSPDDPAPDAALLLPAVRGTPAPGDPRSGRTLDRYLRELTDGHHAYRFRHDERPLGDAEGAFVLCGFVTALAEHARGHHVEAARWFERSAASGGTGGLFAEEFDVAQRQLRGNLPQAFVHGLLLEAAARLV